MTLPWHSPADSARNTGSSSSDRWWRTWLDTTRSKLWPFAGEVGRRGLPEPHARALVAFCGEAAGARIGIDRRDFQAEPVPGGPAGEHHRHVAAPAADVQQGGRRALAEAGPELAEVDAPPAGDGPVDQGKLGVGAVQLVRVAAGQVHLLDGVGRTVPQQFHRSSGQGRFRLGRGGGGGRLPGRLGRLVAGRAVSLVNSAVSTVSPGPERHGADPFPAAVVVSAGGWSRMCRSTNSTVALLMFP